MANGRTPLSADLKAQYQDEFILGGEYQFGDVEVGARFQLTNSVPGYPYPDSAGARGVRLAIPATAAAHGLLRDVASALQLEPLVSCSDRARYVAERVVVHRVQSVEAYR